MSKSLDPKTIKKYFKHQEPPNLEELKKRGERYTDPYFPPNLYSLVGKDVNGKFVDPIYGQEKLNEMEGDDEGSTTGKYKWRRVTSIKSEWKVFEGSIEMADVSQGALGDCYFLTAISALSNYPYLIKSLFRTDEFNDTGYYEIILFIDGEWQVVMVDDNFPYDPEIEDFAYAKPQNYEMWPMLLEKAWAKVNGGYAWINGGLVQEALVALTGFPSNIYKHIPNKQNELFETIQVGTAQKTIMSVGSRADESIEKTGLVLGHAYTLLEGKSYENNNLDIDLIKVRNPWGEGEWTGDWSDKSDKWTKELKKYFGVVDRNDGVFWISVDDYVKLFETTTICYLLYGSIIKQYHFHKENFIKDPAVFDFYLKEPSKVSISALFRDEKYHRTMHNPIRPFTMVLCKYNEQKEIETFQCQYDCRRDVEMVVELNKGFYVLWLYIDYEHIKNDERFKYVLRISSSKEIKVEFVGMDSKYYLIQKLLVDYYKRNYAQNINASKTSFMGFDKKISDGGIAHTLFYNKSATETWVVECSFTVNKAITLFPPFKNMNNILLKIPPGKGLAIIGTRQNYNGDFRIKTKSTLKNINERQYELNIDQFLKTDINESNTERMGLQTGEYKLVDQDKLKDIPVFTGIQEEREKEKQGLKEEAILQKKDLFNSILKDQFLDDKGKKKQEQQAKLLQWQKEKEQERIKLENSKIRTEEELTKLYPYEMNILMNKIDKTRGNLEWKIITISQGVYAGQVKKGTEVCQGKGIFFWKNENYITIGEFENGVANGKGIILTKDHKLIYHGDIVKGLKDGTGKMVFEYDKEGREIEYYDGTFKEDILEGFGLMHFKNGSEWLGPFEAFVQNGVGLMWNGKDFTLVEYIDGCFIDSVELTEKEQDVCKSHVDDEDNRFFEKLYEKKQKERDNEDQGLAIETLNHQVQESEEERIEREYHERYAKAMEEEPFMVEQMFSLYNPQYNTLDLNEKEEFQILDFGKGRKYIGGYINGKRNGIGAYFDGNGYFIGYFKDNRPDGYMMTFGKDKIAIGMGYVDNNYVMKGKATLFNKGNMYKGEVKDGIPNGHGIEYYAEGNHYWIGNFTNWKPNGEGLYFYSKGLVFTKKSFKNGIPIINNKEEEILKKEIEKNEQTIKFFKENSKKYPEIIKRLLKMTPGRIFDRNLHWGVGKGKDGSLYIGEMANEKDFYGRGCYIFNKGPYYCYMGYIKHGDFHGKGTLYNKDWSVAYKGKFGFGAKRGFGIEYGESTYYGNFNDDKKNGTGVIETKDGFTYEGHFKDDEKNGIGYKVNYKEKTFQQFTYKDGNVEDIGEEIIFNKREQKKIIQEQIEKIPKEYAKYVDMYLTLEPAEYSDLAVHGFRAEGKGIYIGEMDRMGLKHGRGIFINFYPGIYYRGYFYHNLKHGRGVIYHKNGFKIYQGNFDMGNIIGKGKYYYNETFCTLEGDFNEIGEGEGTFNFEDGSSWKGSFYGWKKNGTGKFYNDKGVYVKDRKYELDHEVTK